MTPCARNPKARNKTAGIGKSLKPIADPRGIAQPTERTRHHQHQQWGRFRRRLTKRPSYLKQDVASLRANVNGLWA
jgi:hypothetical protein